MAQDGRPEASCGQGRCSRDSTRKLRPKIDALPLKFARKRPRRGPREPPRTIRRSRGESTSRLAVRPTAHAVTWRCTGMVLASRHVIVRARRARIGPVRIKHCICSLAPAALTVTDEHAEMRGGARRAQRQLSEERTWSLCSAEWRLACCRSRGLSASKIWTHLRRVGEVFGSESG